MSANPFRDEIHLPKVAETVHFFQSGLNLCGHGLCPLQNAMVHGIQFLIGPLQLFLCVPLESLKDCFLFLLLAFDILFGLLKTCVSLLLEALGESIDSLC